MGWGLNQRGKKPRSGIYFPVGKCRIAALRGLACRRCPAALRPSGRGTPLPDQPSISLGSTVSLQSHPPCSRGVPQGTPGSPRDVGNEPHICVGSERGPHAALLTRGLGASHPTLPSRHMP